MIDDDSPYRFLFVIYPSPNNDYTVCINRPTAHRRDFGHRDLLCSKHGYSSSSADIFVAKKSLDGVNIIAGIKQMRGKVNCFFFKKCNTKRRRMQAVFRFFLGKNGVGSCQVIRVRFVKMLSFLQLHCQTNGYLLEKISILPTHPLLLFQQYPLRTKLCLE